LSALQEFRLPIGREQDHLQQSFWVHDRRDNPSNRGPDLGIVQQSLEVEIDPTGLFGS
jgi:hypothetical protein